jgi:hypothetical protein
MGDHAPVATVRESRDQSRWFNSERVRGQWLANVFKSLAAQSHPLHLPAGITRRAFLFSAAPPRPLVRKPAFCAGK